MENQRRSVKILSLVVGGAIGLVLFIISGYHLLEFTDSTAFCGRLCHDVMYPEYTTYQASDHSRVLCASCHVGPGASYLVKSKISGIPLILATLSGNYDKPIPVPVKNLRPARETCEACHRPETFSGDLLRTHTTYQTDEANTPKVDVRVLRVGGGPGGSAQGIHWHISSTVWYLALDDKRQNIGWVGVDEGNGQLKEYIDPQQAGEITAERINQEKRQMDCIDCHNRATHVFNSPNDLIDTSITAGTIDQSLPYIKKEGLSALDPPNSSLEQAYSKIEAVKDFYRQSYPQIDQQKSAAIDAAIAELKNIAVLTTFPYMNVTWNTYTSNAGHQSAPGCFRCHGKLVVNTGDQKGTTLSNDCELCHYFDINKALTHN